MRKVPSYLKGLAETRARAAGEIARYERLQADIGTRLDLARAQLAACDCLIQKFDARLRPELIRPITATKGRYGPRGGLANAVKQYLREQWPAEVPSDELGLYLEVYLNLEFATATEHRRWFNNSLRACLKELLEAGLVERCHDPTIGTHEVGRWRWRQDAAATLGQLSAQAAAAGVRVTSEPAE